MKSDRQYEEILRATGDYSDLEEFDKQNEQHIFTQKYEKQKEALLIKEKIKNKRVVPMKSSSRFSKKKIAIIAIAATLVLGTVAVAAATTIGKVRFVFVPDVNDPYTGVMVDADNMTDEELFNHDYIEFEIPEGAQNEDGTPITKESILAGDTRYMLNDPNDHINDEIHILLNTETGELMDIVTFNEEVGSFIEYENDPKYFMLEVPEDAKYEDGTTVTEDSLLTGNLPKGFEQELLENGVIDDELLAKINQVNK